MEISGPYMGILDRLGSLRAIMGIVDSLVMTRRFILNKHVFPNSRITSSIQLYTVKPV